MCVCVCVFVGVCMRMCVFAHVHLAGRGGGLCTVSEQRAGASHRQGGKASSGGSGSSEGSRDSGSEGITLDSPTSTSVSFFPKGSLSFAIAELPAWGLTFRGALLFL